MIIRVKYRKKTLYLYFNYRGAEIYYSTGIRKEMPESDKKKGQILPKILPSELDIIEEKKRDCLKAISWLESKKMEISKDSFKDAIIEINKPPVKTPIDDAILRYLEQCTVFNTVKKMNQLRDKFVRFTAYSKKPIFVEEFTKDTYKKFENWLIFKDRRFSKSGNDLGPLNNNTVATHISSLRTILNFAAPDLNWKFIKHNSEYFNVVFLHPEELRLLATAKIKPSWEVPRDIFLIMCYTGVRHSDVEKLTITNFQPDFNCYSIFQTKTDTEAHPPSSPALKQILAKYDKPPKMSNQKLNKALKKIFTEIGLKRNILIRHEMEGRKVSVSYPLNEIITSHMARKTFIMTLLGVKTDLSDIMDYTGHSSVRTMKPYTTFNARTLSAVTAKIQTLYPEIQSEELKSEDQCESA